MTTLRRATRQLLFIFAMITPMTVAGADIANSSPRVVTSIAPLHGLASAIMAGVAIPVRLLDQKLSPHDAVLRPSQARALARANIVLWIGPELERFMSRMIEAPQAGRETLTVLELDQLERHPVRAGNIWTKEHEHEHKGADDVVDPHVWLSVHNARIIATALATRLTALDPAHTDDYAANLANLSGDLTILDGEIKQILAANARTPFVLLHDSFQYFEKAYDLHPVGALKTAAAGGVSAKRIHEMKQIMKARSVTCIASDPLGKSSLVRQLSQSANMRQAALDPIGKRIKPGPQHYQSMMRANAQALASCLRLR